MHACKMIYGVSAIRGKCNYMFFNVFWLGSINNSLHRHVAPARHILRHILWQISLVQISGLGLARSGTSEDTNVCCISIQNAFRWFKVSLSAATYDLRIIKHNGIWYDCDSSVYLFILPDELIVWQWQFLEVTSTMPTCCLGPIFFVIGKFVRLAACRRPCALQNYQNIIIRLTIFHNNI